MKRRGVIMCLDTNYTFQSETRNQETEEVSERTLAGDQEGDGSEVRGHAQGSLRGAFHIAAASNPQACAGRVRRLRAQVVSRRAAAKRMSLVVAAMQRIIYLTAWDESRYQRVDPI